MLPPSSRMSPWAITSNPSKLLRVRKFATPPTASDPGVRRGAVFFRISTRSIMILRHE